MPINKKPFGRTAFEDVALVTNDLSDRIDGLGQRRTLTLKVQKHTRIIGAVNGEITIDPLSGSVWYFYRGRWRPLTDLIAESTYEASTAGGTAVVYTGACYLVSYWMRNTLTTEGLAFSMWDGTSSSGTPRGTYTLGKYMGANNTTPKYFATGLYIEWDAGVEANLEFVPA